MKKILLYLLLCTPLFCLAEGLNVIYEYDTFGNRISRKVIKMLLFLPPPANTNSIEAEIIELESLYTSNQAVQSSNFFVEKIAGAEISIYPNPATEKITFEITGVVETHERASLQLYSLNGQLLQSQTIHSLITEIALTNLAKGTYILKVHINNRTEDWKIIKN